MATPATPEALDGLIHDPYATYALLRESAPVRRVTGTDGNAAWLVTRYADVREALADPRLSLDKSHALPGNYRGFALPPALDANLLNMDPPDHTRVRRLVVKAFTPGRTERLREPVRRAADALLDPIEEAGGGDLVAEYAAPLPVTVICELLGVPATRRPDFRAWTDALVAPDPARPHLAKEAVAGLLGYFTALIAEKRERPGDDLLSDLIAVRDEDAGVDGDKDGDGGGRLSEDELMSLAFLILFAGYENVVQLIGTAVLGLLRRPEQLAAVRADPALLPGAVEEFMRHEGPVLLAIRRFPVEDVTIGGVRVPKGETVLLSPGSAGRDPDRFADPERLDVTRDASGHLALGHGIHYCLGAPLARMETTTALAALIERFPGLALAVPDEELRWRPSMRARGLLALPVVC